MAEQIHVSLAQAQEIAEATLNVVKNKGYARAEDLGSLASKDSVAETDLATALADKINGKADAATTLAGYNIGDAYTKTETDNKISEAQSSVLKPGGSLAASGIVSDLLIAGNLGKVYNITENFTTTADFVEGSGKKHPAGTNIYVVDTDNTGENPTYKFDVLAGEYGVATQERNGLMSATDKTRLDGIEDGANAYTHPAYDATTGAETTNQTPAFGGTFNISQLTSDASGHVTEQTTRTVTIPDTTATASTDGAGGSAGLMSAADKEKLNSIRIATAQEVQDVIDALSLDDSDSE